MRERRLKSSNLKTSWTLKLIFISIMILWRYTYPKFFSLKCARQMHLSSKNLQHCLMRKKIQFFTFNGTKSFSTSKVCFQSIEKLQEKQEIIPTEGYLKATIRGIYLNDKTSLLSVSFSEAEDLQYPVVWLRDNCQCQECYDIISRSRIHAPLNFRNDIIPKTVTSNENSISITWSDGHSSHFEKEWLCRHSFHSYHQMERLAKRHIQRVPWSAKEFMENFSKICFSFNDVMNDDGVLLKWLETLAVVGVAKLFGAPLEKGHLQSLAKRVSYIRRTHYGEEYYIKGDDGANNVAYKKGALQLHTDMPYYQFMPGVVLLHFVTQSPNGGENILTDSTHAVKQLPQRMYEVLSKTVVEWIDIGFENNVKFHSIYRAPVLCEDAFGNVERVNWSQPQRDSVFNVTPQCALEWYAAFEEFWRILHDPKNAAIIKNVEGDVLTFDNRRILHGRADYTDGRRFLCGAFMDWDEIYSKIRILRQELNQNNSTN